MTVSHSQSDAKTEETASDSTSSGTNQKAKSEYCIKRQGRKEDSEPDNSIRIVIQERPVDRVGDTTKGAAAAEPLNDII